MTPSFREILEVLNQHQIEFIVVGGVAAVIHGAPSTTFDLHTLVRLNEANAERLARALSKLEARFRERRTTIRHTGRTVGCSRVYRGEDDVWEAEHSTHDDTWKPEYVCFHVRALAPDKART